MERDNIFKIAVMIQVDVFNKNVNDYEAWYKKYDKVYHSELKAIGEHFNRLGEQLSGIEVGLGTGKFSISFGIKEGIEPSSEMAAMAIKRGIEVMSGRAEDLPYKDLHFDFILMVTICHLDNVQEAIKEAYRVLKHDGCLILGFLDKNGVIAKEYMERKLKSTFYRHAVFYTVSHIQKMISHAGFRNIKYNQTLFGALGDIEAEQKPKEGYGEGSFVVVSAFKK